MSSGVRTRFHQFVLRHQWTRVGLGIGVRAAGLARVAFLACEPWVLIPLIAVALISWVTPYRIVNFLGISDAQAAEALFSAIAASLAALFGIVVAVLLVALEALRRSVASHAFQESFQSPVLRRVLVLYSATIAIALLGLATTSTPLSRRTLNLEYLCLGLSIVDLVVLAPSARAILSSARATKSIRRLLAQVDGPSIAELLHQWGPERDFLVRLEDNPLFLLSEIAIRGVRDGERIAPRLVLLEGSNLLLTRLSRGEEGHVARATVQAFLPILVGTTKVALTEGQDLVALTGLRALEAIHQYAAMAKLQWFALIELDEGLQEIVDLATSEGREQVVRDALYMLERISQDHLRNNVPPETDVPLLASRPIRPASQENIDKGLQWDHLSRKYVGMIARAGRGAIDRGWLGVGEGATYVLEMIASVAAKLETLGDAQKEQVVSSCYYELTRLALTMGRESADAVSVAISPGFQLGDLLDLRKPFARSPLLYVCNTYVGLARLGRLSAWSLNDLGYVGRHCVEWIEKSPLHADALLVVCETLGKVAVEYSDDSPPARLEILNEVLAQAESLHNWITSEKKRHAGVELRIGRLIEGVRAEIAKSGGATETRITWPKV